MREVQSVKSPVFMRKRECLCVKTPVLLMYKYQNSTYMTIRATYTLTLTHLLPFFRTKKRYLRKLPAYNHPSYHVKIPMLYITDLSLVGPFQDKKSLENPDYFLVLKQSALISKGAFLKAIDVRSLALFPIKRSPKLHQHIRVVKHKR